MAPLPLWNILNYIYIYTSWETRHCPGDTQGKSYTIFPGIEGQIFQKGSFFYIFPEKCKISKNLRPQPHFGVLSQRGSTGHCSRGSNPHPPSIFTRIYQDPFRLPTVSHHGWPSAGNRKAFIYLYPLIFHQKMIKYIHFKCIQC